MKIVSEIIKDIKNLFKIRDKKTFMKQNAPYLVFFYLGNIFASHVNRYYGGSGSGKTRFFVKPNLMQMHSSYCVTDPKGLTF